MARIVFLGTPDFAVPVLRALAEHHQVVGVVTQPDRRYGRGRAKVRMPAAKVAALEAGIDTILQPARLSHDSDVLEQLRSLPADVWCLAAFGQILRREALSIPPHGVLGVHASLLPRHRGAAPIAAAILAGDTETGVSIMLTDEGMDTGPVIAQAAMPVQADDTAETLEVRLANLGASLLLETLPRWLRGEIEPTPQEDLIAVHGEPTYAPQVTKSEGAIDWSLSADELDRRVRAFSPWPGCFCACEDRRLSILRAHSFPDWEGDAEPGEVVQIGDDIAVATGQGALVLDELQMAGRKAMPVGQFICGRQDFCELTLE